jgi:hypothetical protein
VIWSLVDYIQRLHGSIDQGALLEIQAEVDALTVRESQLLAAAVDPAARAVAPAALDISLGSMATARSGGGGGCASSAGESKGEGGVDGHCAASHGAGANGQGGASDAGAAPEARLDDEARRELSRLRLRRHVLRSELEQILARLPQEAGTPGAAAYVPFEAATEENNPRRVLNFGQHGSTEEHR